MAELHLHKTFSLTTAFISSDPLYRRERGGCNCSDSSYNHEPIHTDDDDAIHLSVCFFFNFLLVSIHRLLLSLSLSLTLSAGCWSSISCSYPFHRALDWVSLWSAAQGMHLCVCACKCVCLPALLCASVDTNLSESKMNYCKIKVNPSHPAETQTQRTAEASLHCLSVRAVSESRITG